MLKSGQAFSYYFFPGFYIDTLYAVFPSRIGTTYIQSFKLFKVILIGLNLQFWFRQWKEIIANFMDSMVIDFNNDVFDVFRLFMFLAAIVLHDCVYQFVRLFYHSRNLYSTNLLGYKLYHIIYII